MTVKKRGKQRVETCSIRRGGQTKKKRARMSDRKGKEVRLGIEHTQPPLPPHPPPREEGLVRPFTGGKNHFYTITEIGC